MVFVGASCEGVLHSILKTTFGDARFSPDLAGAEISGTDLAVGVYAEDDEGQLLAFAASAHAAGAPALSVKLGRHEVLVGPLALPGRAGCGRCASERLAAASAGVHGSKRSPVPEVARVAGRVLRREVRAIVREGPERSQLVGHVLAVDLETGDTSLHRVIPLSSCSVCGGAAAFPRPPRTTSGPTPEDSPEVVLDALAGWIDGRTGVISAVILEPPRDMPLGLPFTAVAAPPHVIEDGSPRPLPLGWGKGLTVSATVLSAAGEAIERYAASLPDAARLIWERAEDLDGEFLDPRRFALYTDAQYDAKDFPFARYDPDVRHPWVLGQWLGSGAPVWVPAVFAFLSLTLEADHLICQGSSNGLAASFDPDDAALRATLELVERDALMAAWLMACAGRRVQLDDTLDPLLRRVIDGIAALGATVELYTLPTSACGVTVLCLGLGDGVGYPAVTIGLGTDLDGRSAVRKAVLELGQTGPYLRRMMLSKGVPVPSDSASVREMLDHAAYYFPLERATAFDRLRGSDAPLALRDLTATAPTRSLPACASVLGAAGVRVALVDVASADVATGPFCVVRAVSPDLQPVSYGYGLERQPVERIRRGLAADVPPIHPMW